MWTNLVAFMKALLARRRVERELDEELRCHLGTEAPANIERGMTTSEARRHALIALGGVEQTREAVGDERANWIEGLVQDLRYASRSFRRTPGFTAIAILTLALGLGVNISLFTIVNAVLIRPLPFPVADRLVRISGITFVTDVGRFDRSVFASLAHYTAGSADMTGAGEADRVPTCSVSPSFLGTLGLRVQAGRDFRPDETPGGANQVAIISEGFWHRQFGGETAIGKSIRLNGRPHEIVGIAPRGLTFPGATDVWIPSDFGRGRFVLYHRPDEPVTSMGTVARLQPGITREVALFAAQAGQGAAEDDLRRREHGASLGRSTVGLAPLQEVLVRKARATLLMLLAAVVFLLLIASVNVANMLLARAARRHHELAVRLSLGASRSRLLRQLVTESLLLAALGAAAGLSIAMWTLPVFRSLAPSNLPGLAFGWPGSLLDWRVVVVLAGVVAVIGLACGLAPLRQVTAAAPIMGLRSKTMSARSATRFVRGSLIFVQVTASVTLVAGATLMLRSLLALQSVDLGFDPTGVVTCEVSLPVPTGLQRPEVVARVEGQTRDILVHLSAIPGVSAAASAGQLPLDAAGGRQFFQVDAAPDPPIPPRTAITTRVSADYFRSLGIALVRGRTFTKQEAVEGATVAVLDEGLAARYWPGLDPIGRRIKAPTEWCEVVGVVRTVKWAGAGEESELQVYLPGGGRRFVVRSGMPPTVLIASVRRAVRSIDRDAIVSRIRPMPSLVAAAIATPRTRSVLLGVFSTLAVTLAAVGIYGVVAYLVAERTREIGLRLALGATARAVIHLVVREAAVPLALGVVTGTTSALLGARFVRGQLFGIAPPDAVTLAFPAAVTLAIGLTAAYLPARRAGSVDPVQALKNE